MNVGCNCKFQKFIIILIRQPSPGAPKETRGTASKPLWRNIVSPDAAKHCPTSARNPRCGSTSPDVAEERHYTARKSPGRAEGCLRILERTKRPNPRTPQRGKVSPNAVETCFLRRQRNPRRGEVSPDAVKEGFFRWIRPWRPTENPWGWRKLPAGAMGLDH